MQCPMHLIIHFPEELGLADRPMDKILSEGEKGRGGAHVQRKNTCPPDTPSLDPPPVHRTVG